MAQTGKTSGDNMYQRSGWPGTQRDSQQGAVDELAPQYPPCGEKSSNRQFQFADTEGGSAYVKTRFDADNQEVPMNRPFDHTEATAGEGRFGRFQFEDVDQAGSASMAGYNVIEYDASKLVSNNSVWTDVSRADRGRNE